MGNIDSGGLGNIEFDLDKIDVDEDALLKMFSGNTVQNAEAALEQIERTSGWFVHAPIDSAEAQAALGTSWSDIKARVSGIFREASDQEVTQAPDIDKRKFVRWTPDAILGTADTTAKLHESLFMKKDGTIFEFKDWAAGRQIVKIEADLWVSLINRIALQALQQLKQDKREQATDHSEGPHRASAAPVALKDRRISPDVNIRQNQVIDRIMQLDRVVSLYRANQRQAQDTNKVRVREAQDEDRELRREAQGLAGTSSQKRKAEETPVEEIHEAEGTVEKRLRFDHSHPNDDHV